MPIYRFIVKAASGKVRRGNITEADEFAAKKRLEQAGFEIVSLIESTDLVVHQAKAAPGRAMTKPVRADLIDFEDTWSERVVNFLHTSLLRREMALLLGVIGVIWVVVGSLGKSEAKVATEPEYITYKISVMVNTEGYDANSIEIRLPDIPYKASEAISREIQGLQRIELDFDAATKPQRIEVAMMDGGDVLGRSEGLLQSEEGGGLSYTADLVREKPPE